LWGCGGTQGTFNEEVPYVTEINHEKSPVPSEQFFIKSEQFFIKVATIFFATLTLLWLSAWYVSSSIEDLLGDLKGGPVFWSMVELKLYRLADEPDMPPEKKEKLLKALNKLSVKYHPYLEALFPPTPPKQPPAEKM
jgi:hypothetical protein